MGIASGGWAIPGTVPVGIIVGAIGGCLSAGDWNGELDNDPVLGDVAFVPSDSENGVVYMTAATEEFEKDVYAAVAKYREYAQIRISVLERHSFSRNSAFFSFFRLDGFEQVWRTLPAYRFGGHKMLFD